jgi:hypothetical protein
MLDWQKLVHERLTHRRSGEEMEPEVTEELAHYLEDFYQAGLDGGLAEHEAAQRALAKVRNWPRLARNIKFARLGGEMLKHRIQTLWTPGLVAAILTVAVSITVNREASTLLAARHRAMFVYSGWLLALMGIGAFAAYWSRRAGGSIPNRTAAALFPAAMILAALSSLITNPELKMAVIASVFSPSDAPILRILPVIANSVVGGILLPAIALLAGALPFLREKSVGTGHALHARLNS